MIDWDRVNTLRSEVGEEAFGEVVELFLAETDEVVERLRANPQPDNFRADFHFLKGAALNLGFNEMSALCARNEKTAADTPQAAVDEALDAYARARAAFVAGL